jgi:16S rRNA G966 N2-methylase RsmD
MAQNKLKKKIFPLTDNYEKLQFDQEGLWSITHPGKADTISELIKKHYLAKNYILSENIFIVDATAGLGGNLISFSNFFGIVLGIEIDKNRFEMLQNNINQYNINNITLINDNCIEFLKSDIKSNIVFFDPPWGGPDYKFNPDVKITIDDKSLSNIVNLLEFKTKLICIKLPLNYNMEYLINKIKLPIFDYKLKNMRLIMIDT